MKLKRLATRWAPKKKTAKFVTAPRGAHKLEESLPLLLIVRDMLGLAENAREARKIIKNKAVKVDGKPVKDTKRGVGIFDTIEVGGKCYRLIPKKCFVFVEAQAGKKIVQIKNKTVVRGGKIQLNLNDGRNILLDKNAYKVRDSLLISLPDQKILEHIPFEPGILVFIIRGSHRGRVAKLINIEKEKRRVWLEKEGYKFEAPIDAVMPIGKETALIEVGE